MIERRLSYLKIDRKGHVHVKVPIGIMAKIKDVLHPEFFRESVNDKYTKNHFDKSLVGDLDSIAWFLYIINVLPQSKRKFSKMDMIPLSSEVLKSWLTSRYSSYIKLLEGYKFIAIDHNYKIGKRCKLYNITYDNKQLEDYVITDKALTKRLYTEFVRKRDEISNTLKQKLDEPVFNELTAKKEYFEKIMKNIQIDDQRAYKIISESTSSDISKSIEKTRIKDVKDGLLFSSFDKNGRFHTNFTQLSKSVRNNCLMLNNEKLSEIDIVSCQPQMLYLLMKDLKKDVDLVIEDEGDLTAQELGDFNPADCRLNYTSDKNKIDFSILVAENNKNKFDKYNHYGYDSLKSFSEQLEKDIKLFGNILHKDSGTDIYKIFCLVMEKNGTPVSRDTMKKTFLSFLFSDDSKYTGFNVIRNIWKKQFPAMYSVILHDKIGDHTSIANKLQSKESEFIYGTLMPKLQQANIDFFTVHDCVFVQQSKSKDAYDIFNSSAENFGLVSGITIKNMI